MKRVVILGAGFGGLAAATRLRQRLPKDFEVVIVDRRPVFMAGLRKSWALVGSAEFGPGERSLAALEGRGLRFLPAAIGSRGPCAPAAAAASASASSPPPPSARRRPSRWPAWCARPSPREGSRRTSRSFPP